MEQYLSHHGIIGQKWGIRRFQNKDGSLTEAGRAHLKVVNPNTMDRDKFIELRNSGHDFIVAKGTEMYRTTTFPQEIPNIRKYATVRYDDVKSYHDLTEKHIRDMKGVLGNEVWEATYTNQNDIKVAGMRTQAEILNKMYRKRLKDISYATSVLGANHPDILEYKRIEKIARTTKISDMNDRDFYSFMKNNPFSYNREVLNTTASNNRDYNKFVKELRKKGYEATIDMNDSTNGRTDGPIVILRPHKSAEMKKVTKVKTVKI